MFHERAGEDDNQLKGEKIGKEGDTEGEERKKGSHGGRRDGWK